MLFLFSLGIGLMLLYGVVHSGYLEIILSHGIPRFAPCPKVSQSYAFRKFIGRWGLQGTVRQSFE